MIKRIFVFLLVAALIISASATAFACDEEQTNSYVLQVLFGKNTLRYKNDSNTKKLLSALYICSEQSNNNGQAHLDLLKKGKVSGVPSLTKINVDGDALFECSHNSWEYVSSTYQKVQEERKKLLRKTIIKVLDFGWLNETFNSKSGQIDSFAALLYYTHILADYLANNPNDTKISANGYDIPAYSGIAEYELNGNMPSFTENEKKSKSLYSFSNLDSLGRADVAIVNVGPETMAPSNSRQQIGYIKPSGWSQQKYDGVVNSNPPYLYNRCHLIAHQLANNDTENNLITGTRYLNEAMIPYEDKVANYVRDTGNHVLYRATPVYVDDNLVASGVQLEAYSIEDRGGLCFNVYLYNVQPGIDINYTTGANELVDQTVGTNNIIPFAVSNPSDRNPDLMFEINKHLKVLFGNHENSKAYKSMINELDGIAKEARGKVGSKDQRFYIELKQCQYRFMEKLIEYVPKLLAEESFFKATFEKAS